MPGNRLNRAFTLFEVAISLLIVSFAVVSVLMLFPTGLRKLQVDRYKLYASAIAAQLIDQYSNNDLTCSGIDYEAPFPWEIPIDRRVNHPDLEMKCSTQRTGMIPLPTEIARRLDSDGDEIQHLLDNGGFVYYMQPQATNLWSDDALPTTPPSDLQKIIVGVVGPAQHNASFSFQGKRWPYYEQIPAAPVAMYRKLNIENEGSSPNNLMPMSWNVLKNAKTTPGSLPSASSVLLPPNLEWDFISSGNSTGGTGNITNIAKGTVACPITTANNGSDFAKTFWPALPDNKWNNDVPWKTAWSWHQMHELNDNMRLAYNVFRSAHEYMSYPHAVNSIVGNVTGTETPGVMANVLNEQSFPFMCGLNIKKDGGGPGLPTQDLTSIGIMPRLGLYLYDSMALLDSALLDAGIKNITNLSDPSPGKGLLQEYNGYVSDRADPRIQIKSMSNVINIDDANLSQEQQARIVLALSYFSHALTCFTGRYPRTIGPPPFSMSSNNSYLSHGNVPAGTYKPDKTQTAGVAPDTDLFPSNWIWSNLDDTAGTGGVDLDDEFGCQTGGTDLAFLPGGIDPKTGTINSTGRLRTAIGRGGVNPVFPVNLRPDGAFTPPFAARPCPAVDGSPLCDPVKAKVAPYPYSGPLPPRYDGIKNFVPKSLANVFKNNPAGDSLLTHNIIVRVQELARRHYYRFCARYPYNFAVMRPINQPIMMDHPLLELDMFSVPYGLGTWAGQPDCGNIIGSANTVHPGIAASATPQQRAAQWRYMSPTAIRTLARDVNGRSDPSRVNFGSTTATPGGKGLGTGMTYLGNALTSGPSDPILNCKDPYAFKAIGSQLGQFFSENGPPNAPETSHYTLLNEFEASERCRQLVFWVADWQQYEDCETAPSAPVDASKYPLSAPAVGSLSMKSTGGAHMNIAGNKGGCDIAARMRGLYVTTDESIVSAGRYDRIPTNSSSFSWCGRTYSYPPYVPRGSEIEDNVVGIWGGLTLSDARIPHYRNPELALLFLVPTEPGQSILTGTSALQPPLATDFDMSNFQFNRRIKPSPDYGPPIPTNPAYPEMTKAILYESLTRNVFGTLYSGITPDLPPNLGTYPEIFSGRFGADRNLNHRLDRGPVRRMVRMRATTLCRFNYYDLRAHAQFR